MSSNPASPTPVAPPPRRGLSMRAIAGVLLLLVVAFAAGYAPLKLELNRTRKALETTQYDLKLSNLHRELGMASYEAQRNNFAVAAEHASRFFAGCRELESSIPETQPRTKVAISSYAAQKDGIMGDLALADPTTAGRLSSLYLAMDGVLERRE